MTTFTNGCNNVYNKYAIEIPSYTMWRFGSNKIEGYETERHEWCRIIEQYHDWIKSNWVTILNQFSEWLTVNHSDQKIYSAQLHMGRTTVMQMYRWTIHNSIIIITTYGSQIPVTEKTLWVGAPCRINCGYNKGRDVTIVKIDTTKKKPYRVIIDGDSKTYSLNQLETITRGNLRNMLQDSHTNPLRYMGRLDDALAELNKLTKRGEITLPTYGKFVNSDYDMIKHDAHDAHDVRDVKMKCSIWIDPIITSWSGLVGVDPYCCLWITYANSIQYNEEPYCKWERTKPTKKAIAYVSE
jgi:hypothetical protein